MPLTKKYIEELLDGFTQGNPMPMMNAIHDDVKWMMGSTNQDPRRRTGIFNKAEWHKTFIVDFKSKVKDGQVNLKVLDLNVIESKNLAIAEIASTATQNNGKPYDNRYAIFVVFDDKGEKIVEIREFLDTALIEEVFTTN